MKFTILLYLFCVAGTLTSCGFGDSDSSSSQGNTQLALFGTWKIAEEKTDAFSLSSKILYQAGKATITSVCKKEGGETGTVEVTSSAEFTSTTYKVLEKKEALKLVSGQECLAAWDTQVGKTIKWKVDGDILTLSGDDGSTNTLTRAK
jgi:hypothetical protein